MMTRMTIAAALLAGTALPVLAQDLPAPTFIDEIVVPSGLSIGGIRFGGISDLVYNAATGSYLAISDDRIEHGPARFYDLRIGVVDGQVMLDIAAMHELTQPGGAPFDLKGADGEGLAIVGERLYWSSERDANNIPSIHFASMTGAGEGSIDLPAAYMPDAEGTRGIYTNLGHEGLAATRDGSRLIAATENGLAQDGGKATLEAGSPSRILVIDTATNAPVAEHIYMTETIHAAPAQPDGGADNGVSGIETLPDGRLVVVERSFAAEVGTKIRFYLADLSGADNVLGQDKVDIANTALVSKSPWFELDEGSHGLDIDNIESFAFGPVVDGQQLFVIASDDNFNAESQFTQFVVFSIPAF